MTKTGRKPRLVSIMAKEKKQIEYFPDAIVECACGNRVQVGSTQKETKVEICSACHPLFTGRAKLIDKAGRVEKFQERMKKSQSIKEAQKKRRKETKK